MYINVNNKTKRNIALPNLIRTNCVRVLPLGIIFLILCPIVIKAKKGRACPSPHPIIAPKPPQVAASDGPIKIQTPKHDATNEAVNDLLPIDLSAFKYELIESLPLE